MSSALPTPRDLNTRETTNICRRKPEQVHRAEEMAVGLADEQHPLDDRSLPMLARCRRRRGACLHPCRAHVECLFPHGGQRNLRGQRHVDNRVQLVLDLEEPCSLDGRQHTTYSWRVLLAYRELCPARSPATLSTRRRPFRPSASRSWRRSRIMTLATRSPSVSISPRYSL